MSALEQLLGQLPNKLPGAKQDNIFTPPHIVQDMIDTLPKSVWNSKTKFLDPACKSGIFLYKIYEKLMEALKTEKGLEDFKTRREHILNNQLFGIALDPMTQLMSVRTVYGYLPKKHNIRVIKNYIQKIKDKNSNIIKEEFGEDMEFNVIIGNPPYQDEKDKKLYCKFMLKANEVAGEYASLIVKNKWMTSVDKDNSCGFNDVRKQFLTEKHCREIIDFPVIGDVFKDVGTSVCYYLYDKKHTGECSYTKLENGKVTDKYVADFSKTGMVLKSKIITDIANKVYSTNNFSQLDIYNKPCGFETSEIPNDIQGTADDLHPITYITSDGNWYASLESFDSKYHKNIKQYNMMPGSKALLKNLENLIFYSKYKQSTLL